MNQLRPVLASHPLVAYFAVASWHALYDFFSASRATTGTMNAVMSMVVLVWVIAILVTTGFDTLSSSGKVAAGTGASIPS